MVQKVLKNPYADFDFYKDVYFGRQISDENEFKSHAVKAADFLDVMTWNRIPSLDEKYVDESLVLRVKKAVCAMAELSESSSPTALGITPGLTHENNDGYSVTYAGYGSAKSEYEESLKSVVVRYLADTGLLYRGGGEWHE